MIKCIDCGGNNVLGAYVECNLDEWEKHWECVNNDTALGNPEDYTQFYCEDCGAEWENIEDD